MNSAHTELEKLIERVDPFLEILEQEARTESDSGIDASAQEFRHPDWETLCDYVQGRLAEHEAVSIRKHVAQCSICARKALHALAEKPKIIEDFVIWVTSFWEPQLATAAGTTEQKHLFEMEDGDVNVSCYWRKQQDNHPAYVSISWKANITIPGEFWARFESPETEEILAEVFLGSRLNDEATFTSQDLGFDPVKKRWTIAIVLKKAKQ